MAEAFIKTFKRDYVWFGDLKDAQTVMKQLGKWMEDYNEETPHKASRIFSPRELIKGQKTNKLVVRFYGVHSTFHDLKSSIL